MLFVSCCLPRAKIMVDLGRRPCLINTTMQFHPIRMGRGPAAAAACLPSKVRSTALRTAYSVKGIGLGLATLGHSLRRPAQTTADEETKLAGLPVRAGRGRRDVGVETSDV